MGYYGFFILESIHTIYDLIDYYWAQKVNQNMNIYIDKIRVNLPDKL